MSMYELDRYFADPTTARSAQNLAKGAREVLGEVDPFAPGERPNQIQAFRSYQQGMSTIISTCPGCDQNYGSRRSLIVAARRMHDSGPKSERSMAVAYVLASENLESFLELMRRLDEPLRQFTGPEQGSPHDRAKIAGGTPPSVHEDPAGVVARPECRPAKWGVATKVSSAVAEGRGSSRDNPQEPRANVWPSLERDGGSSYPTRPSSPRMRAFHERLQRGTIWSDECSTSRGGKSPPPPPASLSAQATDASPVIEDYLRRCSPQLAGGGGVTFRRAIASEQKPSSSEESPSEIEGVSACSGRISPVGREQRPDRRPATARFSSRDHSASSRGNGVATPGRYSPGRWTPPGSSGDQDSDPWAQAWFAEHGNENWVRVLAEEERGTRFPPNRMDISGTFGTDMAVTSPAQLFDRSGGDFAFISPSNGSSSSRRAPGSPSPRGPDWCLHDYDTATGGGFRSRLVDQEDDGAWSDGSEEVFPEPDPSDLADGGLPCLSRRPLGDSTAAAPQG
ncbi:unnamed protein product [Ectocarpus sp. CCAP 1310/34]|nr:unnamed protein product [Ectocarpus sp. CCAP 1310/34]